METDDNTCLFVYFLLSRFGDVTEALKYRGHHMTGNVEVMALWARFSSEGMTKMAVEEFLMMAYEQV